MRKFRVARWRRLPQNRLMQHSERTTDASSSLSRRDAYAPVAMAIDYLVGSLEQPVSLEALAEHVGLSPDHFQRVFKAGAGVSPKRFQQYLATGEAKRALVAGESVFDASLAAGLSGPSRLHDLFLVAEAMTPGAFRRKGAGETIRYGVAAGPYGAAFLGVTDKGICWLSFDDGDRFARSEAEMRADWPAASFVRDDAGVRIVAEAAFAAATGAAGEGAGKTRLHVVGSNFQLKVWDALLRIPEGACVTYGALARAIGQPKAARAVGAAVGANNISHLIPCHRVILASGAVHNYRWGAARKRAILALEGARSAL